MTGKQFCETTRDGDTSKFSTLLSTQGAQSFMNYKDTHPCTQLHVTSIGGYQYEVVTKHLTTRRNVNLQTNHGFTLSIFFVPSQEIIRHLSVPSLSLISLFRSEGGERIILTL
jgi:hypothetical protein